MATNFEPNPPAPRKEDFPKTSTIPEGWVADALQASENGPVPATGGRSNESTRPTAQVDESLFTRGLDPFPKPNTIPGGWDPAGL